MQHEEVRKSATREIPRASEAAHAPACRRIPTRTGWGTPSARTWPAAPWRPKRLRTPAPAPDSMPPARLKGDLFPQSASAEKRTSAALTEMPIGLDSRTGMWAIRRGIARSAPPKQKQNSGRREPPILTRRGTALDRSDLTIVPRRSVTSLRRRPLAPVSRRAKVHRRAVQGRTRPQIERGSSIDSSTERRLRRCFGTSSWRGTSSWSPGSSGGTCGRRSCRG